MTWILIEKNVRKQSSYLHFKHVQFFMFFTRQFSGLCVKLFHEHLKLMYKNYTKEKRECLFKNYLAIGG